MKGLAFIQMVIFLQKNSGKFLNYYLKTLDFNSWHRRYLSEILHSLRTVLHTKSFFFAQIFKMQLPLFTTYEKLLKARINFQFINFSGLSNFLMNTQPPVSFDIMRQCFLFCHAVIQSRLDSWPGNHPSNPVLPAMHVWNDNTKLSLFHYN